MSRLLNEWKERKAREDDQLHEQLCHAVLAGRVQVFTDPRVLDFQGSPVHLHWDHLLPLTVLMTLALIILLATNVVVGIVVMTLCTLAHLFGNKYYIAWRLKDRALAYMIGDCAQFQALWQLGGVALVIQGGNEAPCLAPKGDWRKFIRRNLGEGDSHPREAMANAPVPVAHTVEVMAPPPPPPPTVYPPPPIMEVPPSPFADSVEPPPPPPNPHPVELEAAAEEPAPAVQPFASPQPGERWASIAEEESPPRDEVVPPS